MGQLLRGGEIPEIDLLDCGKPVLYFPVRHHSPVCSFHLKKAVEACAPDCILVEGPINAQKLIPVLAHPDTKAPVALYYFYRDTRGLVSEEKEDYRCYYPFLDASPELTALREAAGREIPVYFIDLPYGEILIHTGEGQGIRREAEKQTYNDDYLLSRSRYFSMLCEKTGMRSFEELWEKYFEIGGLHESTEAFVRQMFTYCYLSRVNTPAEELEADGCLCRERFMAEQIAKASGEYRRILVVTGGFHTYGLTQLLKVSEDGKRVSFVGEPIKLHGSGARKGARGKSVGQIFGELYGEDENQGVYPLAYSMEAADALNGYASGMQSPGFYQLVYQGLEAQSLEARSQESKSLESEKLESKSLESEKLESKSLESQKLESKKLKSEKPESEGQEPVRLPEQAYEEAVLQQLVNAGRRARQKGEGLSSYDTICALSMAKGLAVLRGKRAPGLYELRDAALASFVKGEVSLSTDQPLRILDELNTGKQVGKLCETTERPPLLSDFEDKCRRFGLQLQSSAERELTLEPFTKNKHLAMSRFLYQMEFLETQFAVRKKGSDLLNGRDRSRIREIWSYRFSGKVLAALVDVSMAGSTVEEAAKSRLLSKAKKAASCREASRLLVQGFLMGFLEEQHGLEAYVRETLVSDGDFFSLTAGFSYLKMLYELQELYQVNAHAQLEEFLEICFGKIVQLLPSMAEVPEERQQECMECCRELYQMTGHKSFEKLRPPLMEAMLRLAERDKIRPGLYGAVLGLLYGWDGQYSVCIRDAVYGYLKGSGEMRMRSAAFLRGLFYTARDFVFVQEYFLSMVDELLAELSADEFLQLLPELRMAFGYFTPFETDRIAGKAAALHGAEADRILKGRRVPPHAYEYGEFLDTFGRARGQVSAGGDGE